MEPYPETGLNSPSGAESARTTRSPASVPRPAPVPLPGPFYAAAGIAQPDASTPSATAAPAAA